MKRPALMLAFAFLGLSLGAASCAELSATLRLAPPVVEYGCNASPPNNRCIVTLRDSIGVGNMPTLKVDTVPIGTTRTVTITRTMAVGERVVVLGSFEGLTATNKKAVAVTARIETINDPDASPASPILRFVVTP